MVCPLVSYMIDECCRSENQQIAAQKVYYHICRKYNTTASNIMRNAMIYVHFCTFLKLLPGNKLIFTRSESISLINGVTKERIEEEEVERKALKQHTHVCFIINICTHVYYIICRGVRLYKRHILANAKNGFFFLKKVPEIFFLPLQYICAY